MLPGFDGRGLWLNSLLFDVLPLSESGSQMNMQMAAKRSVEENSVIDYGHQAWTTELYTTEPSSQFVKTSFEKHKQEVQKIQFIIFFLEL